MVGWNCNISMGVTLGISNRGKKPGVPLIGNNVYLGPGAKIMGKKDWKQCRNWGQLCGNEGFA